jgi:hypothetical protein
MLLDCGGKRSATPFWDGVERRGEFAAHQKMRASHLISRSLLPLTGCDRFLKIMPAPPSVTLGFELRRLNLFIPP